ncbi:unnamed protein product [Brassica oleracea var. botrytis]
MIGPTDEINFQGYPIAYIAPSVYGHSHALTLHFLSYAENMVISIGVDSTTIPNPHKLWHPGPRSPVVTSLGRGGDRFDSRGGGGVSRARKKVQTKAGAGPRWWAARSTPG